MFLSINITSDTLTSFFVIILTLVISGISKIIFEKANELIKEIRNLAVSNVLNQKDIKNMVDDIGNHEKRINILETKN